MKEKNLRILISNDDGIDAPGLAVLEKIASDLSDDVWVVAPEVQQSATGHSLTTTRPVTLTNIAPRKFFVTGTPTDCVLVAINRVLTDKKPDLVLSGVNYGSNVAETITYSGTVAAAMEATLLGIPAIAMSLDIVDVVGPQWEVAHHFGPDIVRKLVSIGWPVGVLMNVNFPAVLPTDVRGIKMVPQGLREINDLLMDYKDPRGRDCFWVGPEPFFDPGDATTDLGAIWRKYISVTPLHLDLTHHETLQRMVTLFDA